jgi:hypothetical protein
MKKIVCIQHQIWKENVTGTSFYTGRPDTWCIKYSLTSKREVDAGLPVHDVVKAQVLLKRAIQALKACKELLTWQRLSLSVCPAPAFVCVGHFKLLRLRQLDMAYHCKDTGLILVQSMWDM